MSYNFVLDPSLGIVVPEQWSNLARTLLKSKYMRRAGVPVEALERVTKISFPLESVPSITPQTEIGATSPEYSAHQVFSRLVLSWGFWGLEHGYFNNEDEAKEAMNAWYDDLYYQRASPNSPQWFNTGLHRIYGVHQAGQGGYYFEEDGNGGVAVHPALDYYSHPQASACFISTVEDSLLEPNGIMDFVRRETSLFRHGSGSGANLSNLRGENEPLSGGGKSSGVLSFHRIFDTSAGAVKSGGVSRRAAKMASLDVDHPDIEAFVNLKAREEAKAAALVIGSRALRAEGYDCPEITADFNGEAYATVAGQNANNSVGILDAYMEAVQNDGPWELKPRTGGPGKTVRARALWDQICKAAWLCGDPGLQFLTTLNEWHTCSHVAPIRASNPCSEYVFIDNSACNLASINLLKVVKLPALLSGNYKSAFADLTKIAARWTTVLDITVGMAQYPSESIAYNTWKFRTLGLGYANLGALLMQCGQPYDSTVGRTLASEITKALTTAAYRQSAALAQRLGTYPGWDAETHGRVLRKHEAKGMAVPAECYQGMRNAQCTLLAPTGTIGLVMDCDTTGVEPDFALVKHKVMVDGTSAKIVNQSVPPALANLGYNPEQIRKITDHVLEHGSVEGAPYLSADHVRIFDCANDGANSIEPKGHVLMMAAVQPHLDGAISKTVNLPMTATPEDISAIYMMAWNLGIKAIAVFRSNCKLSQPLSDSAEPLPGTLPHAVKHMTFPRWPNQRRRLPSERNAKIVRTTIGGQTLYFTLGQYPNGDLGEVFAFLGRPGEPRQALMDALTKAVSIGLQYGVPLEEFVDAFTHSSFPPNGLIFDHPNIKSATSPLDLMFRHIGLHYLGRKDLAHVPLGEPETTAERAPRRAPEPNLGYTGDVCGNCGATTMVRNGTCLKCVSCGTTTGCS